MGAPLWRAFQRTAQQPSSVQHVVQMGHVRTREPQHSQMRIVFDLVLCGDWAGGVMQRDPDCKDCGTCAEFVSNHPERLAEAYWDVRSVRVFQPSRGVKR